VLLDFAIEIVMDQLLNQAFIDLT